MTRVGDLVICQHWTLYPHKVGQIVSIKKEDHVDDCGDIWSWEYSILVDGEIKKFLQGDFEVVCDEEK